MSDIEKQIKSYSDSKRRMVISKLTGKFGFVHEAESKTDTVSVFYPYPEPEIIKEADSNVDFCALDGQEFKYSG